MWKDGTHAVTDYNATQSDATPAVSFPAVHPKNEEAARRPPRRIESGNVVQPHLESPQLRQVMQPSIMTTAAVLHLEHSCAPCG